MSLTVSGLAGRLLGTRAVSAVPRTMATRTLRRRDTPFSKARWFISADFSCKEEDFPFPFIIALDGKSAESLPALAKTPPACGLGFAQSRKRRGLLHFHHVHILAAVAIGDE